LEAVRLAHQAKAAAIAFLPEGRVPVVLRMQEEVGERLGKILERTASWAAVG
jgi:hypothetical protein